MAFQWTRDAVQHLYRRAGFGARPAELDAGLADGRRRTVAKLLDWESIPTAQLDARLAQYPFDFTSFPEDDSYDQFLGFQQWLYLRMIYSPRVLEEKLTLFWHMHFATSYDKVGDVPLLYRQNQLFRTLGGGKFRDLLLAVSKDPAMLLWLDNATNVKDAPNENFAREVMELFTMGIGHYSQRDVTEAARAFTGWTIDFETYEFVDDPEVHDDGEKTLLGNTGAFRGEDVIAILASRPETAERITRKLAMFFLGDAPRHALARRLADIYFATDGNIRDVVREILLSDDFTESRGRRAQVVTPTEYMVAAIRALDLEVTGEGLFDYAYLAGQALYLPPNVAGWNGGLQWINTGSYLARMNFANDLTSGRAEDEPLFALDAAAFFGGVQVRTADDLIDFAALRLGMPQPSGAMRDALRTYLAPAEFWNAEAADRWGRGTLHLLLASPEFQLQ